MVDGMLVSNGTVQVAKLSNDVLSSTGDVLTLIGLAIGAAIIIGLLYGAYLLGRG
jgi:hypothetical protein